MVTAAMRDGFDKAQPWKDVPAEVASVAGPAPCFARFLLNSINRSRVWSWIFG
jgi:hypothetical protein